MLPPRRAELEERSREAAAAKERMEAAEAAEAEAEAALEAGAVRLRELRAKAERLRETEEREKLGLQVRAYLGVGYSKKRCCSASMATRLCA